MGEGGVKNQGKFVDVVYGWSICKLTCWPDYFELSFTTNSRNRYDWKYLISQSLYITYCVECMPNLTLLFLTGFLELWAQTQNVVHFVFKALMGVIPKFRWIHTKGTLVMEFQKEIRELAILKNGDFGIFCFISMKISQSYLGIKDGSIFWWLPWLTAKE